MARKNRIIGCGCRRCRWGMHHSSWSKAQMTARVRSARRVVKTALKTGDYDKAQDIITSSGYLD